MKIKAISSKFPSRLVSKEETLDLIRHHSKDTYEGNLDLAIRTVSRLLHISGADTRYWLDKNEQPIDFIAEAVDDVLKKTSLKKTDIDLLIYVGVGRGYSEPGNSYLVAKTMGMEHVECFDILDACMSYTRALHLANSYLKQGLYQHIMIVNGEFNNIEDSILYPENYKLQSIEQVEWTFPTYTVGDVASATILSADDQHDWNWAFHTCPDYADLCTAPLPGYQAYTKQTPKIGKNGVGNFSSFGSIMHEVGAAEITKVYRKLDPDASSISAIFPHASSKSAWEEFADELDVKDKLYLVYPKYGNLVSASVPTGIYLAEQDKRIKRGDTLLGWVGSAGMSFSAYSFTY